MADEYTKQLAELGQVSLMTVIAGKRLERAVAEAAEELPPYRNTDGLHAAWIEASNMATELRQLARRASAASEAIRLELQ